MATTIRPLPEVVASLHALHRDFTASLAARGQAAWPSFFVENADGQSEGACSIAIAAELRAEATAAERRVSTRLVELRADVDARRERQALLQRYADLRAAVTAKQRMVAALQAEISTARAAMAVAEESGGVPPTGR
jgi:hypothetical protein